ncbi:BLUF domain-containing protein [Hymenobacter setariae]|uniref:BLUF domain-containing protein n=1 Tax=Hymenobacter setariae TaxID=2594794 RepID=A0A558C4W6_9BACT|nr:BLUF domain-containing protein [Hymenobacter setariae]TVT43747.1 BLUF domain-containing protein [Hymenobacter setariae]
MHHIIYLSRATKRPTDDELTALLAQARVANAQQNVTGALVYGDGQFMQIIEGEEATLAMLYARLLQDGRHEQVFKFADKPIAQRSFADWSMAFRPVSAAEFAELAGYVTPEQLDLRAPGLSATDGMLLQMMKTFVLNPGT